MRVLLDSGFDGDLVFVDKDKPMLLSSLKRLVAQSWNTSNGRFQTTQKAKMEPVRKIWREQAGGGGKNSNGGDGGGI